MADHCLGIDFGGTRIQAALDRDGRGAEPLPIGGKLGDLPALAHWTSQGVVFGENAYWMCKSDEENALGYFRRLLEREEVRHTGKSIPWRQLGAAFMADLRRALDQNGGSSAPRVVVAVPGWLDDDCLGRLAMLFRDAGFGLHAFITHTAAISAASGDDPSRGTKIFVNFGAASTSVALCPAGGKGAVWLWHDESLGETLGKRTLNYLAEECIAKFRKDPRENPHAVQALFQGIEEALQRPESGGTLAFRKNIFGNDFDYAVGQNEFAALAGPITGETANALERLRLRYSFDDMRDVEVLASGRNARFISWRTLFDRVFPSGARYTDVPAQAIARGAARAVAVFGDVRSFRLIEGIPVIDGLAKQGAAVSALRPGRMERRIRYCLEMAGGDGERRTLPEGKFRLGRNPLGEWVFPTNRYPMISGAHCVLHKDGDEVKLVDLGSSNGTFLNGKRVLEAFVANGDVIRLGADGPELTLHREMN